MEQIAIKVKNIRKEYNTTEGKIKALDGMNFEVEKNKIVSIIGPSSCGKSTLLKILGGIIKPTSGDIYFDQQKYEKGLDKNALNNVGYVFQTDNLLPWRTIRNNLQLPLEILKPKDVNWDKRIEELLEMVGLLDFADAYPYELSGGMRQRIGVIRGLVHNPEIILMDQPFGALDAITRKLINYEFLDLWKKTQKTILLITNDIEEALLLSSKVLIMSNLPGKIIHRIDFDIPINKRNRSIIKDKKYNELSYNIKQLMKEEITKVNENEKCI